MGTKHMERPFHYRRLIRLICDSIEIEVQTTRINHVISIGIHISFVHVFLQ